MSTSIELPGPDDPANGCVNSGAEITPCTDRPQRTVESSIDDVSMTSRVQGDETGSDVGQELLSEESPVSVHAGTSGGTETPASKQAVCESQPKVSSPSKPLVGKANGTTTTPTAKMIDSGNGKAASSRAPVTSNVKTTATTVTKKSTATASAPAKAVTVVPPPSRRASVIPSKPAPPPVIRPSLSSSTTSKPITSVSTARASLASPTGPAASSATRPRASVSEGVKRTPPKPPTPVATKPVISSRPTSARPGSSTVPTRASTSIASIREIKENGKVLEVLEIKLKEAAESLDAKNESVIKLEEKIAELSSALEDAQTDAQTKNSMVEQLGFEKAFLEKQLHEERRQQSDDLKLTSLQEELEAEKVSAAEQIGVAQGLRDQIQALENQASQSKQELEALQASASSDAAVAVAKHEALFAAQTNLATVTAEIEALRVAHSRALEEAQSRIVSLEAKGTMVDALDTQIISLRAEKEENANKLSELEIEVLELKEMIEAVEEERDRLSAQISGLQEQLVEATAATQEVIEQNRAQAASFASQVEANDRFYQQQLSVASENHANVVATLENVRSEIASVASTNESLEAEIVAAKKTHAEKLAVAQQILEKREADLLDEIKNIAATLEAQEAIYNSKVGVIKVEHEALLQEAFARAKQEAADDHAQELQALRASSSAAVDQIQVANQAALSDLKAEHAAALDSEVARLEKITSTLRLELRATQDDLAKAKLGLESSRAEISSLTNQRDEARASAVVSNNASAAQDEAARLVNELARTKDDLMAADDLLALTKASLDEISNNHSRELEEAARVRVEEVKKLRNAHDVEVTALVSEKSKLLVKLSDLEGEVATLRATMAVEPIPAKSNGHGGVSQSPSVTKEELQRMHEAHNLKIHDLQADHQKAIKMLKDELEASASKIMELQQDVDRKTMEIQYLEQDQEDSQEQMTRLKEEVKTLNDQSSK